MPSPDRGRWCGEHQRYECVSRRKNGQECHSHRLVTGADKCRMHLGRKAQPVIAEAKAMEAARKAVETYGLPRDISPTDALLEEVRWTAGHVTWLREQVQALEAGDLIWGMTEQQEKNASEFKGTDTTYAATAHIWLELYYRERKHLVDVTKAAISAGIEERKVKLAEQQGALVAGCIRAILADLELSAGQQARVAEVVPRHLRALAG